MAHISPPPGVVEENYLIYQRDGRQVQVELDSPAWQDWLENATSFSFKSAEGSFTAHKTRASNGRGGWYWYAYRRLHGQLSNLYLGTSAKLTLQRLREAARVLSFSSDRQAEETAFAAPELNNENEALLLSKLRVPRLSPQHVARPRLLSLLNQGVLRALTLVEAPAGSGKTTLLAEWASQTDHPLAWISLETADNDPTRFLSYLVAALTSLDERIEGLPQPGHAQNPERALTGLLNELTCLLEQEAVLVLDDYHLLTTPAIHALLGFLLDHLPARLHVMIGTRVDPPLSLARLRARDQLSELRAQDLRFTPEEVEALASTMGLLLSNEATNLLAERAEGWIAGVQLLALALRGQTNATAFLRAFHGTHRFLLDYVGEEVLAQQTPATQDFLLRTCVLDRLTGPLCEAVTDLPDGQKHLADLLRANLFVSALDETEIWYRYHPLFAETLRGHLQKQQPELIPELYRRASRWHEEHQGLEEACDYALLAGDFPHAAQLIADLLPRMVEQGHFAQLGRWLVQLPPELIASSPQLYIVTPWLHTFTVDAPELMEQTLQRMEQHVQQLPAEEAAAWVEPQSALTFFKALNAMGNNDLPGAFRMVRLALGALNARKTPMSQLISRFLRISLSLVHGVSGDLATAEQLLLDLSQVQSDEAFSLANLMAPFLLGELYKAQGLLHKGNAIYTQMGQRVESHTDIPPLPLLMLAFAMLRHSSLLYEWNYLPQAAHMMRRVMEILPRSFTTIIPRSSQPGLLAFGLWAQARIAWAQGQPEAAEYFLELASNQSATLDTLPPGKERPPVNVAMLAARLALICGQNEEAEHWESTWGIRFDDKPVNLLDGRQIFAYFTLARVLIARGRGQQGDEALSQALTLLDYWRTFTQKAGFQGWLIEVQMLTALALQARGQFNEALHTLGDALAMAEAEGYVRLFIDEGQPMAELLSQVGAHTTASPVYLRRLQNALPASRQALLMPAQATPAPAALDPLSGRENEVLTLLAAGCSNQQIADRLVISLNTAKRHVKNILAKLDATNRTQAVARARELHLL